MTSEPPFPSRPTRRVRISCPGCDRNDWVPWPEGRKVFHWKCFNCAKEFDLTREGAPALGGSDGGLRPPR